MGGNTQAKHQLPRFTTRRQIQRTEQPLCRWLPVSLLEGPSISTEACAATDLTHDSATDKPIGLPALQRCKRCQLVTCAA